MEQHFLDVVNPAWDAADWAPHSRRPWWPISEDSAPWPLPLYPVLGEGAGPGGAYDGQLLCSPCWRLPSVYERYRRSTGDQSPWEASPAQPRPSVSLETLETLETPAAAAREPEPAEESASQPIAPALWPNAGDGLQIAENVEGARPAERRPSRRPAGWCPHPDFSGCLRWIRRAVCSLSRAAAGCCAAFLDVKEP